MTDPLVVPLNAAGLPAWCVEILRRYPVYPTNWEEVGEVEIEVEIEVSPCCGSWNIPRDIYRVLAEYADPDWEERATIDSKAPDSPVTAFSREGQYSRSIRKTEASRANSGS